MNRKPYPGAPITRHFQVESPRTPVDSAEGLGHRRFRDFIGAIERLNPLTQFAIAIALEIVIGVIDLYTGTEIQLSILYLIPVSLVAWHRGWNSARVFAAISMLVWLVADQLPGHRYSSYGILFWNTAVRGMFFLLFAYVLAELRNAVDEAQRLARTDSLTGVANSRSFLEIAALEVARQNRYGQPLSIGFIDCDNFKEVNDLYGHAAGDDLLRMIATTIHDSLRSVDTVARLGGDEFAILLPETPADAADVVCDKVRDALRQSVHRHGVTFSCGLVTYLVPPDDVEQLLHSADEAMYDAKKTGKDSSRHLVIGERRSKVTNVD